MSAIEPSEIYERTRKEGKRRLARPLVELAATALVGGFDVAFGVAALGLAAGAVEGRFGSETGRLAGALGFGIGFVFVVVGRSELFTENFLVPIAGLDRRRRRSWLKLGELWLAALVLNLAGGVVMVLILTSNGVLSSRSQGPLVALADRISGYSSQTAFLSAIVAGALMTLLTWFVEGAADSMVVRIVMAWVVGALIVLGTFNHSIVSTIELVAGSRYGADVGAGRIFANLGLAVGGNLVGGLGLVTFARFAQSVVSTSAP